MLASVLLHKSAGRHITGLAFGCSFGVMLLYKLPLLV